MVLVTEPFESVHPLRSGTGCPCSTSTSTSTTDIRARALEALAQQTIELPSWAFGNSGTRFKVFGQPGVARNPYEKLEDAARVHAVTGVAPRVSLHIPW